MKSIAFVLALMTAGIAQAQTQGELCYAYLSLPPSGVQRLIAKQVAPVLKDAKLPAGQRGRVLTCMAGAVQALQPQVRDLCLVGTDPSATLRAALPAVLELCLAESVAKPTVVVPAPAEVPES